MKKHPSVHFDRNLGSFVGLSESIMKELHRNYPNVALEKELARMTTWLKSSKGKQRKGTIGFIINWLNNATTSLPEKKDEPCEEIPAILNPYLEELWKEHPHLYLFNRLAT